MDDRTEKIGKALDEIDKVIGLFYDHKEKEGYQETNVLIGMLMELDAELAGGQASAAEWMRGLTEAMEALEQKDTVLFADILQYDIAEQIRTWETLEGGE